MLKPRLRLLSLQATTVFILPMALSSLQVTIHSRTTILNNDTQDAHSHPHPQRLFLNMNPTQNPCHESTLNPTPPTPFSRGVITVVQVVVVCELPQWRCIWQRHEVAQEQVDGVLLLSISVGVAVEAPACGEGGRGRQDSNPEFRLSGLTLKSQSVRLASV